MRRLIIPALCLAAPLTGCWQLHEQESVRPHEEPALAPPPGAVAVDGAAPLPADGAGLENPLERTDEVIAAGHLNYRRYCWQCHGGQMDGQSGIVGQALPHLERSLLDASIQDQADGEMFMNIHDWSGLERRSCPPMGATMTREEIWETVHYLRSVAAGDATLGEPADFRYGAVPADEARLDRYRPGGNAGAQ